MTDLTIARLLAGPANLSEVHLPGFRDPLQQTRAATRYERSVTACLAAAWVLAPRCLWWTEVDPSEQVSALDPEGLDSHERSVWT